MGGFSVPKLPFIPFDVDTSFVMITKARPDSIPEAVNKLTPIVISTIACQNATC